MTVPENDMDGVSDGALLVAYGNGDQLAARELTRRLTPMVLGLSVRMLNGDRAEAEDVAQEAMLRLWKIAGDWRQDEAKVTTWLYRVVANLCTDRLRKRTTTPLDSIAEPIDAARPVWQKLAQTQRLEALQGAIDLLPERQKQALVLRHLEALSNPEIGDIMGISVDAVESLSARAKRALARILAGRKEELGYQDD